MAAVLHELLKERGDWTTYADLAEDLKRRCARVKIPYHAGLVSQAIEQVEGSTHRRLIQPPDGAGIDTAPPEEPPPPSREEAVRRLQQLRVALPPSMPAVPPVREVTPAELLRRQRDARPAPRLRVRAAGDPRDGAAVRRVGTGRRRG